MIDEVLNQIGRRQKFVLTSHARPDGDAVGSVLACGQILRSMGKQADVFLSDGVPYIYKPLPFAETVVVAPSVPPEYEAAIILECDSVQRTRLDGLENHYLINIDHHSTARPFANVNWIDPSACATAEMIFRLAREAGVKISSEIATCLYTAVLTDTGSFCFNGTNERTFALGAGTGSRRCRSFRDCAECLLLESNFEDAPAGLRVEQPASRRRTCLDAHLPRTTWNVPKPRMKIPKAW